MKLLNRANFAVRFATAKEKSRFTLQAILATENETVATDGHVLARVSLPNVRWNQSARKAVRFESVKRREVSRGNVAKDIENSIPKKTNLPILAHAAITVEHIGDRDIVKVAATDLETPKVFTVHQPDGQFPNWQAVWPDVDNVPTTDICFDAKLLADVATAAAKFSNRPARVIRMRFYGPNSAARFDLVNDDGQEMNGLIMPVRGSVESTFHEKPKPEPEPAGQAAEPEPEPEPAAQAAEPEPEPEPAAQAAEPEPELPQCFTCGYIGEQIAACVTCQEPVCPACLAENRHSHEDAPRKMELLAHFDNGRRFQIFRKGDYYQVRDTATVTQSEKIGLVVLEHAALDYVQMRCNDYNTPQNRMLQRVSAEMGGDLDCTSDADPGL